MYIVSKVPMQLDFSVIPALKRKTASMRLHNLTSKFIAVILALGLLAGAITLIAFNTGAGRVINELALHFCAREALLEKNKVASIIDREVALARKMADDLTLRNWAGDENNREYRRQAYIELESYRRLFRDKSFFIALAKSNHYYVFNKKDGRGRIEMATLDPGKADDGWFFRGLGAIDGYALNLDYNATLHEAKVWLNAIMTDQQGNRIGICGGGISLNDFLKDTVYSSEKGLRTILIDRAGIIQAHENRAIVEHNANTRNMAGKITIFSLMDDAPRADQLRRAIGELSSGAGEVRAFPARFSGRNYLLAISQLPGVGWYNVVLVDVSRVISMTEFFPIAAALLLALMIALTIIAILINRMVLAPLTRLSGAAGEIAGGRYDIVLPVNRRDELSALTTSFNTMAATIRDHTANLEMRVRQRTGELHTANRMLEDSRQKIMESIAYARMIQSSILPGEDMLRRCLGDYFVLYRPKEVVGGDFYHLREFEEHFLLSVIDCTGHGVPGAFMTMTVNAVLNHVIDAVCNDNPAKILANLNRMMRDNLRLSDVDAGLDISLCMVERRKGRLIHAGAGLPLTVVAGGDVRELRGDRQRIGYRGSRPDYEYSNHELILAAGDRCYLTSDGLFDEPGGDKGYGFGRQRFHDALTSCAHLDMSGQAEALARILDNYRGEHPQRDDITLLGFSL